MSTIAEGGLFPAIVDSYMPAISVAQLTSQGIEIQFDVNYNDISDITVVHVSLTRQSNYHSTLNRNVYYRGVYATRITLTSKIGTVIVPYSALQIDELAFNEYYKIQVRLSSDTKYPVGGYDDPQDLSEYLTNPDNLTHFSEWSTVCLARFINNPTLQLKINGQDIDPTNPDRTTIDSSNVTLSGQYITIQRTQSPFVGQVDQEYLNRYKVSVYQGDTTLELVWASEYLNIDVNNVDQFTYTIPYYFDIANYQIRIDIETANLYTDSYTFNIGVKYDSSSWGNQSVVQEAVAVNNVLGKVNISFFPFDENTTVPVGSQFVIRRADDNDGFTIWEEIYTKTLTEALTGTTTVSFDDFTVESGVLYKYEITFVSTVSIGGHTHFTITEGPAMTVFDHAFLTGEGTQLCVKFNPNVGNFQINVAESQVAPIGSQYPFSQRGADTYYRTFSLSGTIAYEMDVQHQFATRSSIYGEWIEVYGSYFVNHYMNQQNDRVTQRKFREIVMRYLYDDVPKLYRSTPEGNILVKLSGVSLSPKNELGRLVYDFSCTATEIGEACIENYKLYQIQDFGE